MRKAVLTVTLIVLAAAAIPGQQGIPEPDPIPAGQAPRVNEYDRHFDAQHYALHVKLPQSGAQIHGTADILITVSRGAPEILPLDLTGLAVSEVRVDGKAARFSHEAGKLSIALSPRTARDGGKIRLLVTYDGTPDDGLVLHNTIHGRPAAFADNWPNRARFWFPALDYPADKATASFIVEAPERWDVIANGVRESSPRRSETDPTARVHRWRLKEPVSPYNMIIGAAEFQVQLLGRACAPAARCTEVSTWLFPESAAKAAPSFRRAVAMVEYFNNLIAPFPYRQLAHVQSSTRFGGMENATAIFYAEKRLAEGVNIESTVAHETAHQWFGDAVTQSDWHHLWLSEGFATYMGAMFFQHADGEAAFRRIMQVARERIVTAKVTDRPIVDLQETDLFSLLNANNYQKGSWVLHMLRGIVGDAKFKQGIRQFYRAHEHGTVLTADFQRAMEAVSGMQLGDFFKQWVYEPGYPRLRVVSEWDPAQSTATVRIEQTQPQTWPTFNFSLDLRVTSAAGVQTQKVTVSDRVTTVRLQLGSQPTEVVADPDGWLLKDIENTAPTPRVAQPS